MTDYNRLLKKYESDKDKIVQPKIVSEQILAPPLSSHIFIGKSGSGKSNLLTNVIMNPAFYGGWFDAVVLISPTAQNDSIQQQLRVPPELSFSDLKQAPTVIDRVFASQKRQIKEMGGSHRAPKIAMILDDVMSDAAFMRSSQFLSLFTQSRHYNVAPFVCIQACRSKTSGFPKSALLNAGQLFCFCGSASEIKVLSEVFCPPLIKSEQFEKWIYDSTKEPYTFIHINNKSTSFENRFRSGLGRILSLDTLRNKENEKPSATLPTYGSRPTTASPAQKEAGGTAVGGLGKNRQA